MIILVLILSTITLSGCIEGFVDEEQYNNLISGVCAYDTSGQSYFYGNDLLQNNIEFDTQIEYKEYCKLEIWKVNDCKIRGVVFVVRSLGTVNLKFTAFANNVQLYSKQKEVKSNSTTDIDLFFEPYEFLEEDEFYITIEQIQNYEVEPELVQFKFDGVMVAFTE
jgi:hypothetical protein